MTKKQCRVRIMMIPYQDSEDSDPVGHAGPLGAKALVVSPFVTRKN